jgi:flagellar biosynthetic protein FlhB
MSQGDDAESREHAPTQKKLDAARARGDVAQAADLAAAASYAGHLAAFVLFGAWAVSTTGAALVAMIDRSPELGAAVLGEGSGPLRGIATAAVAGSAPLFLVPSLVVVLAFAAMRTVVLATERILPKASRIDPIASARHRFGPEGLFEFAKSFAKLVLVSAALGALFLVRLDDILALQWMAPGPAAGVLGRLSLELLAVVAAFTVAIGLADFLWQKHRLQVRNRMSRQELVDELRQSEGDPHVKMSRRQRAEEIATSRMLADVATADVVIVNPTHFAVALRWKRGDRTAPVCVAKGTDGLAARIREIAAEAGIPVRPDPPTARAIFASVEVGQEIRPEHYRPVAAAIRFAEQIRARARSGGWVAQSQPPRPETPDGDG